MTEHQQEKPTKIETPKPINQALILGGAGGLASLTAALILDMSGDAAFKMATTVSLAGGTTSLFISWYDGRLKTQPRKRQKRENVGIPFTTQKGTKYIDMEFSIEQGGYVLRESYGQALWRKVKGNERQVIRQVEEIDRPKELDEFVFYSSLGLQLRQVHVDLFLKSAWRNRDFGKGLSARRWVRNFSQRPAWYQELSPAWYYSMLDLLRCAGNYCQFQLVAEYENGWRSLVNEPRLTMRILKWYEVEKRKGY